MIFRTYHEGTMYVIEAPEGSRVVAEGDRCGELALFEMMPGGTPVDARLPSSVVVKAADRGYLGLEILEQRSPKATPRACSVLSVVRSGDLAQGSLADRPDFRADRDLLLAPQIEQKVHPGG